MKSGKWRMVYVILGLLLIGELVGLFMNSATIPELSTRADRLRRIAAAESDDDTILPGDIYDRSGIPIAETDYRTVVETDENDKQIKSTRRITRYSDGKAFSQLIGYTGKRTFSALAESDEDVIGARNDARLMAFLDEEYWGDNGIYSTTDVNGTRGQSATLTIDSDLQVKTFSALSEEMSSSEEMGSAVVMNAKTGEILADVSFPTYDFNDLDNALKQMQSDAETTNLDPGYPVTYKNPIAPGSIFKIMMAVSLIDNGMEDYVVNNSSYTMDNGWTCLAEPYNNGSLAVGEGEEIGLEHALNVSSNVYFSKAALALGRDKMLETAKKFMFTEGETYIPLDFGNVRYNWDLNGSNSELAQSGFGQGRIEWTTISAAMVTQAIANKGSMMKPYMVRKLADAEGKVVYEGTPEVLSQATSPETASKVAKMMRSTAVECCRAINNPEVTEIFDRYQVAGKTGTSENGDEEDTINSWYVSFAPANDPEYVVVVNQCKTPNKKGFRMMPVAAKIYEYLFENR